MIYHFLNKDNGLQAIKEQRLRVSNILKLNDPFEFLGVDLSNIVIAPALEETKKDLSKIMGIICFSKNWKNPLMWGHYADSHRGICLGFSISKEEFLMKVNYVEERLKFTKNHIDEEEMKKILGTKFKHWQYEEEYRLFVNLNEEEAGNYYFNFSRDFQLQEVILGCSSELCIESLNRDLGNYKLSNEVEIIKARPSLTKFELLI